MIVRSYSRNKPCIRPEHIIRLSSTHHLSALNISSESSELFIRNIRTFRQKHPSFSSKTSELFVKTTGIFQANACHSAC
ncbi:hypothetical protein INE75_04015 [Bacteroides uniformis CL03T12C37]|nr:hypothetical protein INE75_04015 [Bacteroides uniformis CL03T12C37]